MKEGLTGILFDARKEPTVESIQAKKIASVKKKNTLNSQRGVKRSIEAIITFPQHAKKAHFWKETSQSISIPSEMRVNKTKHFNYLSLDTEKTMRLVHRVHPAGYCPHCK